MDSEKPTLHERIQSLNESDYNQKSTQKKTKRKTKKRRPPDDNAYAYDSDEGKLCLITSKPYLSLEAKNSRTLQSLQSLEVKTSDHNCESFIRKMRRDEKMTYKPDWPPGDVNRRLSYKKDRIWSTRQTKRILTEDFSSITEFKIALSLGSYFLCCIKTENLSCENANKNALRLVFQKNV